MNINNINVSKKYSVLIGIVLVFVLTNPSRSSFASYLHRTGLGNIGRDFNGLLFSVYSKGRDAEKEYYIGVLGNFFKSPAIL